MFDLSGKIALVTGASGGIGAAVACKLAEQKAKVLLAGRNESALQKTHDMISENGGDSVILPAADLSNSDGIEQLLENIKEYGAIHILVNNAGITKDTLAMRMKDEDWYDVIDINLTSPFLLTKALLRSMMKNKFGRIINISSIVGATGNAGQTNYCASKAGMVGWSKALALEVASRGITVNCIAPGFIKSAMTDKLDEKTVQNLLDGIPIGRMGEANDVAHAAVYLASDEATWVTGQVLHINGGMAMY